ncbi:putative DNA-binding SAP protein [Trachipleistophora hominis]|uniref:Putative DNA-binding SAP protein n=1 Tax=Trachipleistophora hominis TaxID=72359 RepID=L7JZJ0_TRAHO|nr:putative DNA-binding SAP protein [Trachipleistophora hominis]
MDFKKLTVAQLREECKKRDINTVNLKKTELIEHLLRYEDGNKTAQCGETGESSSAAFESKSFDELSESEKIQARIRRFACNKPGENTGDIGALDAVYAKELQEREERQRRFSRPADK